MHPIKGTSEPLKSVVLRWRHPNLSNYSNCVSNATGNFQGVLYSSLVQAEVRKIGSTVKVGGYIPNDPPLIGGTTYYVDDYNYADWLDRISTYDLVCISKHILGIQPLATGYDMLAADANRGGTITTFDVVELRKLLLGIYQKLPAYNTPWIFVPEYIPHDYPQFNTQPNSISINGSTVSSIQYTDPSWQYTMPNQGLDKSGYDAIKIGDACQGTINCPEPILTFESPNLLIPNQTYEINVKASGFLGIESFQLGMFVDHNQLEVQDISSGNLPEFSKDDNVGLTQLGQDNLNVAWFKSNVQPYTLTSSANSLFKIKVKVLQPVSDINTALNLSKGKSSITSAFFNASGCVDQVQVQAVITAVTGLNGNASDRSKIEDNNGQHTMLYCYPNPAKDQATIVFESNDESSATLTISDLNGKLAKSLIISISKGINTYQLDSATFQNLPVGVLNVSLRTQDGLRTGRLVKI